MIPLSNGKSPRIDKFYATLREYKSSILDREFHQRSEEDKSIEHIRSLGKEILDDALRNKNQRPSLNMTKTLNCSTELLKHNNLYDKYRQKANNKKQILMVDRKDQILKEITATKEKPAVNKKYSAIPSKISSKAGLKGLNYVKRVEMKAQELRNVGRQAEESRNEMKKQQSYFNKTTKLNKEKDEAAFAGVLQRSNELAVRRSASIQKIRHEQYLKQMEEATFTPKRYSKELSSTEKSFGKRAALSSLKRLEHEKNLIQQAIDSSPFSPHLNFNPQASSKIKNIWSEDALNKKISKVERETNISQGTNKNEEEERTAHSTTRITLRNMNEISFVLE